MKRRAVFVFGGTLALLLVFALKVSAPHAAAQAPGDLGVIVTDLTPEACRAAGIPSGVLVVDVVRDGPAARKGIEPGDLITEYENEPVRSAADLVARMRRDGEGFLAGLRIRHDGTDRWIGFVPLAALPEPPPTAAEIDDRFTRLEDEIDRLEARIEALEKTRAIPRKPAVTPSKP